MVPIGDRDDGPGFCATYNIISASSAEYFLSSTSTSNASSALIVFFPYLLMIWIGWTYLFSSRILQSSLKSFHVIVLLAKSGNSFSGSVIPSPVVLVSNTSNLSEEIILSGG